VNAPGAATASSRLDPSRTAALSGLLSTSTPADSTLTAGASAPWDREHAPEDPIGARVVVTVGIALVAGGAAALLAVAASGSLGPGRLSTFGPAPGPVALAVGLEVLLGAAILLLAPRSPRGGGHAVTDAAPPAAGEETSTAERPVADDPALSALAGGWTGRRVADEAPERPTVDAGRQAAPTPIPGAAAADARTEPIDLPPLPPPGERGRPE
jgi:hypothetical protein